VSTQAHDSHPLLLVPNHTLVGRELPGAPQYQRRTPETTVLYRVVQRNLEPFLAFAHDQGRVVSRFVERELRAFLDCGLLCRGFLRVRCQDCGRERLVAYSCKGRAFCPSCGARRMADTAAHLVDRVFPAAPVRQYVLSLPFALRYRLAFDHKLCSQVLRIFVQTVFSSLKRRARRRFQMRKAYCGSVTFVQRAGGSINLNPHFHSLILDGVYVSSAPYEAPGFGPLPPPSGEEVARITATIARRVEKLLVKEGLFGEDAPVDPDPLEADEPLLSQLYSASVQGRVASGPRAGERVLRLGDRIDVEEAEVIPGARCASVQGFSLHADVCVPARDRRRLERLCRYVARPPIATERLSELPDGRILYRLRHRWRDGTTHVVFEPLDLVARLAVLVPPPRANTVPWYGIATGFPRAAGHLQAAPAKLARHRRGHPQSPWRPGAARPACRCEDLDRLVRARAPRQPRRSARRSAQRPAPYRCAREGSPRRSCCAACSPSMPSDAIAAGAECGSWPPSTSRR
jgi:hypothetical protein